MKLVLKYSDTDDSVYLDEWKDLCRMLEEVKLYSDTYTKLMKKHNANLYTLNARRLTILRECMDNEERMALATAKEIRDRFFPDESVEKLSLFCKDRPIKTREQAELRDTEPTDTEQDDMGVQPTRIDGYWGTPRKR